MKTLLLALALSVSPFAAQAKSLVSSSYKCNAFNPMTGYASLQYSDTSKTDAAALQYGMLPTLLNNGSISLDEADQSGMAKANMQEHTTGVRVNLIFLPAEIKAGQAITLYGVSYIPYDSSASAFNPFIAPYTGLPASFSALAPYIGGGVPTASLVCEATFKEI